MHCTDKITAISVQLEHDSNVLMFPLQTKLYLFTNAPADGPKFQIIEQRTTS